MGTPQIDIFATQPSPNPTPTSSEVSAGRPTIDIFSPKPMSAQAQPGEPVVIPDVGPELAAQALKGVAAAMPGDIARYGPILPLAQMGMGIGGVLGPPGMVGGGLLGAAGGVLVGDALGRGADAKVNETFGTNVQSPELTGMDYITRPALAAFLEIPLIKGAVKGVWKGGTEGLTSLGSKTIPQALKATVSTAKSELLAGWKELSAVKSASAIIQKSARRRADTAREQAARYFGATPENLMRREEIEAGAYTSLLRQNLAPVNSEMHKELQSEIYNNMEILFNNGFFKRAKMANPKVAVKYLAEDIAGLNKKFGKLIDAADQVSDVAIKIDDISRTITDKLAPQLSADDLKTVTTRINEMFRQLGGKNNNNGDGIITTFRKLNEAKKWFADQIDFDALRNGADPTGARLKSDIVISRVLRDLENDQFEFIGDEIAKRFPEAGAVLGEFNNIKTLNRSLSAYYESFKMMHSRAMRELSKGQIGTATREISGLPQAYFAVRPLTDNSVTPMVVGASAYRLQSPKGQLFMSKANRLMAEGLDGIATDITEGLPRTFKWLMERPQVITQYMLYRGIPQEVARELEIGFEQGNMQQQAHIIEQIQIAFPQLFKESISGAPSEYQAADGHYYLGDPGDLMAIKRRLKVARSRGQLSVGDYSQRLRDLRRDGRLTFVRTPTPLSAQPMSAPTPTPEVEPKTVKVGTKDDLERRESKY